MVKRIKSGRASSADVAFMQEALSLARINLGRTWPGPSVGCVLVKEGEVVGRGATQPGGHPHAEVQALNEAAEKSYGSTAYVSLEPCSHFGKSPPCTDILIDAGIVRVVAAMSDPDPRVNGSGFERLKTAGIDVDIGVCHEEASDINVGFFHRLATGQPLVVALDADRLTMGDLFYGAAFFDAVLTDMTEWLEASSQDLDSRLCVVVDDTSVAPAALSSVSSEARNQAWLVAEKARNPSRLSVMGSYLDRILEIDTYPEGGVDLTALLASLGDLGLTCVAVDMRSALADRLKQAGLI